MKKSKKNNTIYYVIAAIVVIIIIAVLVMKKPVEEAPVVVPEPEPEPAPEYTTPAPTEEVVAPEAGEDIPYADRGILSDVKCEGGVMSAIITNVQEEEMNIVPATYKTDIRIQVNGIVSKWFICDKDVLAPGEYTYCSSLLGPEMSSRLTNDAKNEVAVWFMADQANRGTVTGITCSGSGEAVTVEDDMSEE